MNDLATPVKSWKSLGLICMAAFAWLVLAVIPAQAGGTVKATHVTEKLISGGKPVTVEKFEPTAEGVFPALIFVHGIDGLEQSGTLYRAQAQRLAEEGYVVLLVHYFDRSGTRREDALALLGAFQRYLGGQSLDHEEESRARSLFGLWREVIVDTVPYARKLLNVDGSRVGLVGFSMGAFLSLSVAAEESLNIAVVVDLFGGLPPEIRGSLLRLPPTLVIHGEQDHIVPVAEAQLLVRLLSSRQLPFEVKIYPGVSHMFLNKETGIAWLQVLDAEARLRVFLQKHLAGQARKPHLAQATGE